MNIEFPTISHLFDQAIAVQRASEAFYARLTALFTYHSSEISEFWNQFAEEDHAATLFLEAIRNRLPRERLEQNADPGIFNRVKKCLEETLALTGESIENLEDAYRIAQKLESSENHAIYEFMVLNFAPQEITQPLGSTHLKTHERIHRLKQHLPQSFRTSSARKKISADPK